jgi:hypothetical protein
MLSSQYTEIIALNCINPQKQRVLCSVETQFTSKHVTETNLTFEA